VPWSEILEEIRNGNEQSVDGLYAAVSECARARLFRSVEPQVVDDHVQEVLMIVMAAIRNGELRNPDCLMGFVRTVTRRQVAVHIRGAMLRRRRMVSMESAHPASPPRESPEACMLTRQRIAGARKVLEMLCARDRNILIRFYYEEQDSEHICREMHLTATQFRLYKSRALLKCCQLNERPRLIRTERLQSTRPLRIA
jgi:DNA-directed RNA polymerase specialized sigma24 family protein